MKNMFSTTIAINKITNEALQIFREQAENAVKVAQANAPMDTGLLVSSIKSVVGINSKKDVYLKLMSPLEYAEYQHDFKLYHLVDLGKSQGLSQIGKTLHDANPRKRKKIIRRSSQYAIGYKWARTNGVMKQKKTQYLQKGLDFIYPKIAQKIKEIKITI